MTSLPTRALGDALESKGFARSNTHHQIFWLVVDGKKTAIRTRLSHGAREYGDALLGAVANQMRITRADLRRFVECELSGEQYLAMLRAAGHVRS